MPTKLKYEYQQPTHVLEPRHVNAALDALPNEERDIILRESRRLAEGIRNMGSGIALEVLARIGALI